jgi:glycosidase
MMVDLKCLACPRFVCLTLIACLAGPAMAEPLDGRPPVDDVIYHFMPIAWRDSDNDANRFGDFNGMTASLDYLEDLGITAVWMNPIFPSPAYHGYHHGPGDQVNSWFGTEAQFLNFVAAAHTRGIKVYLDNVVYGISHNSTWYQSARNNPASPYDDWLAFTNSGNSQYLGSVYTTWSGASVGFIHWNLNNAGPMNLVTSWAQHWLDPNGDGDPSDGIDGYRLDHVWAQYPSGPNGWGYNIDTFWTPWKQALQAVNPDVFIFAEQADWGSTGAELLSAFDASMTKPFEFAARDALNNESASGLYSSMASAVASLPPGRLFHCIIGDHDVDRLASVIGGDANPGRLRAAAAVLLTQPFPPMIYFGDELGMRGFKGTFGTDANDIPLREPFKWNAVAGPPMSNYWILHAQAYNNRYAQNNDGRSVQEQEGVPGSLLEHYRALIAARRDNVALRRGAYHAITNNRSGVWSFVRHAPGEQTLLVAINLSSATTATLDLSNMEITGGSTPATGVFGANGATLTSGNQSAYGLPLAAYECRVLQISAAPVVAPPQEIDGQTIPTDLGPAALRATQNNATGLGDNVNELNQLFVRRDGDRLRIGITGNLATDGTGLAMFFDTQAGGQTTLSTSGFATPPNNLPNIHGMQLDAGFAPDYVIFANAFGGSIYVDHYTLATGGNGTKRYLGSGTVGDGDGFLNGSNNTNAMEVALHNGNLFGVTAGSAAGAATAVSGFELDIAFADLGLTEDSTTMRVMAMIVRSNGEVGNQFLPGLGGGYANLGQVPLSLESIPGPQYLTIALEHAPGDWNGDGTVDLADYAGLSACLTGPGPTALAPGCPSFDFAGDVDVDLEDVAEFQRAMGP